MPPQCARFQKNIHDGVAGLLLSPLIAVLFGADLDRSHSSSEEFDLAVKRKTGTNRSAFIREQFEKTPKASVKDIVATWKAAGNKEDLSPTLVYQVKKRLGMKSGKRGRPPGRKATAAPIGTSGLAISSKEAGYAALEAALDGLVDKALMLGDKGLVEALRAARRHASAKLV